MRRLNAVFAQEFSTNQNNDQNQNGLEQDKSLPFVSYVGMVRTQVHMYHVRTDSRSFTRHGFFLVFVGGSNKIKRGEKRKREGKRGEKRGRKEREESTQVHRYLLIYLLLQVYVLMPHCASYKHTFQAAPTIILCDVLSNGNYLHRPVKLWR